MFKLHVNYVVVSELLKLKAMKLLGSIKSKRTKDGDGKNVPHLQTSAPLNYC